MHCKNTEFSFFQVVRYDTDRGDWMSSGDRLCGRQMPQPVVTKSERVRLIFRSNQDINGEGFKVRLRQVQFTDILLLVK